MTKGLTEDELKALVEAEMRQSLGYSSSKLSQARQKSMYYYLGMAVGDLSPPEVDGRSSVVSTDVRDTIESMMPQLMVTFVGSDTVAEFEATKPGDEQKAEQATEYVNYLFYKKNNGHRIAYTWMKDALLQKNGIVKVWWDTRNEETREEYRGLSEVELTQLMEDDEVEVIGQSASVDEDDAEQRQQAIAQLMQQAQAQPQSAPQVMQQIQHIESLPPKLVYDVDCKRTKTDGKVCIENVPPEEFLIARNAKDIETASFVAHRVQRSRSELKSMGYKNVDELTSQDGDQAVNSERVQRLSYNDENAYADDNGDGDKSQDLIWVLESYIRCDFDGDGIAELRKVTMAGNTLLDNEAIDAIPFVSITPVPLPHQFFGLSVADLAMESQKTKTSILRSQLDNMYLAVNGRYFAVEGQVNLDDLLTSRPGGVVRVKQIGAAGRLDQGAPDIGNSMQMMEYMQQDLENKTGWTRYSQGNDSGSLNDTATGVNVITNRADMRLDLIARNFSEGYVDLFKLILKYVCQYRQKKETVKLTGGWVDIDPREWSNQFDVSINVGIGMGNKDQKIQHLTMLGQVQAQGLEIGIATPDNIYHAATELSKQLGFKNADKFFTDPSKTPPQQKPDPEQAKAQAQMQIEQAKLQSSTQLKQMELQHNAQLDQAKRDHELQLEQARMQMQAQVDANRQQVEADQKTLESQQQAQLDALKEQQKTEQLRMQLEFDQWKTVADNETKVLVAQIQAHTSMSNAQTSAATKEAPNGNA
ncbi:hypothetical protein [Pseudomonas fluorescens]|uniref:portal protein n=1 Tax=Pseudomonas fluorescens TaxID=294 RepID=UPI0005FC0344|nr:hypothetical protein [Pseudomonas fluorescens]KJZ41323.1 hypothetical protein VC33_00300 [Pseudomonas fluorescens]